MFVLRTISCADGLTQNQFIGKKYTLVRKEDSKFKELHDRFWNVKDHDDGRLMHNNTCALLIDENDVTIPLMYDHWHYIMSANGQTFEKI